MRRISIFVISVGVVSVAHCARYHEAPLGEAPVDARVAPPSMEAIRARAETFVHPILQPIDIDLENGLSPDEAAVLSVLLNPSLTVLRDERGVAEAQLIQAGILPNPQFGFSLDVPTAGSTVGTVDALGLTFGWDALTTLLTRGPRLDASRARRASVELDIAWSEWQVAQAAKLATLRLAFLDDQLDVARREEAFLSENVATVTRAVELRDMTLVDLTAAEAALRVAQDAVLSLDQRREEQRLDLNRLLGLGPERDLALQTGVPASSTPVRASLSEIVDGLEQRRLDLMAFRLGYQSQEARLRAAVRAQFPSIQIGLAQLRDTGNVVTTGFGLTISLPFLDRNQGAIALERASRAALFDEYTARVFEARAQAATILANLESVGKQVDAGERSIEALGTLVETYFRALLEGDADVLTYYNARKELTSKQVELLSLQQRMSELGIALEIAAGRYFGPESEE